VSTGCKHLDELLTVIRGFGCEYSPVLSFLQRLPGFMAHWKDMMCKTSFKRELFKSLIIDSAGSIRLIRPTDIYIGPTEPRGGL
jgi:hypothetical protein